MGLVLSVYQYIFEYLQDFNSLKAKQGIGEIRHVVLYKEPDEGLGMSITVSKKCQNSTGKF